jgi:hypothetical protein
VIISWAGVGKFKGILEGDGERVSFVVLNANGRSGTKVGDAVCSMDVLL